MFQRHVDMSQGAVYAYGGGGLLFGNISLGCTYHGPELDSGSDIESRTTCTAISSQ